jgi:hypothetical protein
VTKPAEELDARIAAAFSEDAKSAEVARLLAEVKEAASAAELAAETARKHALDPVLSGDDLKLARREMDDAAFKTDRLQEASAKLAERVEALKALEADRRMQAEHERVLAERDRLAEEMARMADPIVQIAHLVRHIEACDREIGRLNATSAAKFGHIRIVLSEAAPANTTLFQDALVWDTFIAVAGRQAPQIVSGWAGAKDKLRVRRSASSPATGENRGPCTTAPHPPQPHWRQEPLAPLHVIAKLSA